MKVLLLCGDYWHPGEVPVKGTAPLVKDGFQIDVFSFENDLSQNLLKNYPVILKAKCEETPKTYKTPQKTEAAQKIIADYVEGGGGLVAVHSAVVNEENTGAFNNLTGCRFLGHPNNCPVTVAPLKKHPITEGVGIFCETDEHYHIDITADDADIFLASYSGAQGEENKYREDPYFNCPASIRAAGYARVQGKGRVCVLTPGHLLSVWLNPQFQRLLANALKWCGK